MYHSNYAIKIRYIQNIATIRQALAILRKIKNITERRRGQAWEREGEERRGESDRERESLLPARYWVIARLLAGCNEPDLSPLFPALLSSAIPTVTTANNSMSH